MRAAGLGISFVFQVALHPPIAKTVFFKDVLKAVFQEAVCWEFHASPVVRTWCFHCLHPGFDPSLGKKYPASRAMWQTEQNKKKQEAACLFNKPWFTVAIRAARRREKAKLKT